ncbi:DUF4256 domain-containing protein [Mucilaginibacter aquatilis]|uniref:DUF4256 family protein n=1 Tax=Mucilaginibacter aquatilis TaxID=1517760 RepID=A0A6I4I891_9SPHI|nr:DUF4256 domain-containing protein [Mucilaginibacter aquatilis]MVN91341.1 DUF4256 family protein [Mucilaginibacter aquatilis]
MNIIFIDEKSALLAKLKLRFLQNMHRHNNLDWDFVESELNGNSAILSSVSQLEQTGGEPDVIIFNDDDYVYCDCSKESPCGRRSLCYDEQALSSRKEAKPQSSALAVASSMGVQLLDEYQYCKLQEFESFDTKTSSWLLTPPAIRDLGGAIFGDCRYNHVFIYHNGASSYYAARGFRAYVPLK